MRRLWSLKLILGGKRPKKQQPCLCKAGDMFQITGGCMEILEGRQALFFAGEWEKIRLFFEASFKAAFWGTYSPLESIMWRKNLILAWSPAYIMVWMLVSWPGYLTSLTSKIWFSRKMDMIWKVVLNKNGKQFSKTTGIQLKPVVH